MRSAVDRVLSSSRVNGSASSTMNLFFDLRDSTSMLCARSRHIQWMYLATAPNVTSTERMLLLQNALSGMHEASLLVAEQESRYRVSPPERISGWRKKNPTAYGFGYLWTVHSLYYFWREYGLVQQGGEDALLEPCYLNVQEVSDCAVGVGKNISDVVRRWLEKLGVVGKVIGSCLSPPEEEYVFPRDLYRYSDRAKDAIESITKDATESFTTEENKSSETLLEDGVGETLAEMQ